MANSQRPAFQAYTVVQRENQDDFFIAIGAAFPHRDESGYNIILQALPLDGKIVLRAPKERDDDSLRSSNSERRENSSRRRSR
jgi:hypothetical protein